MKNKDKPSIGATLSTNEERDRPTETLTNIQSAYMKTVKSQNKHTKAIWYIFTSLRREDGIPYKSCNNMGQN